MHHHDKNTQPIYSHSLFYFILNWGLFHYINTYVWYSLSSAQINNMGLWVKIKVFSYKKTWRKKKLILNSYANRDMNDFVNIVQTRNQSEKKQTKVSENRNSRCGRETTVINQSMGTHYIGHHCTKILKHFKIISQYNIFWPRKQIKTKSVVKPVLSTHYFIKCQFRNVFHFNHNRKWNVSIEFGNSCAWFSFLKL